MGCSCSTGALRRDSVDEASHGRNEHPLSQKGGRTSKSAQVEAMVEAKCRQASQTKVLVSACDLVKAVLGYSHQPHVFVIIKILSIRRISLLLVLFYLLVNSHNVMNEFLSWGKHISSNSVESGTAWVCFTVVAWGCNWSGGSTDAGLGVQSSHDRT